MPHPLEAKIGAVRRRAARLVWSFALSRLFGTLVAVVVAWTLLDALIRFQDRGVRIIGSLSALAIASWAAIRCISVLRQARYSMLDVALKIERRFPELRDRLASTVQFLHDPEDDPQAGSALLRRAVIGETASEAEQLDFSQALEQRPARRALTTAAAIACLALTAAALYPTTARTALVRLLAPWSNVNWPQLHHLAVKDPVRRLAAGQPLEVTVVDAEGVSLPDEVWLHLLYPSEEGAPHEVVEPMRFINDEVIARKESVSKPLSYRAVGGDDRSMPWIDVEVVEPPEVEQLALKLHYPKYTGWPPESSERHIRALTGTRVELTGRASKPLSAATIEIDEQGSIPAQISADGFGFSVPSSGGEGFVVKQAGAYWVKLTDRQGFSNADDVRYEIRAIEDVTPSVALEEPGANAFVTPEAVVPVRIEAKDDLGLAEVALRYSRSDQSEVGDAEIKLYARPAQAAPTVAPRDPSVNEPLGEQRTIEHRWELGPLKLKPGVQLNVYATATDYKPLTGTSQPRRLTVISTGELAERLAERQNFVLGELARMLKLQRESREQVSSVEIQLQEIGSLTKQDVDHLQAAELTQRQIDRGLVSPGEGVAPQIAGLLADLANNKVDNPDVERHMRRLMEEINRLGKQELPVINRELTAAMKSAQSAGGKDSARPLTAAGQHQDEVIRSLEQMLGELAEWDNYRRFHREIGQLRHDQESLNEQTAELGRQTLTKDFKDLTPQQQADLKKLSARQLELSRQFDKIEQRMERTAAELENHDPLAAGTISDALHEAREQAVAGGMRQAGRQVAENQMGQATTGQRQIGEQLQEVLDILANRRENELARLVKKLREAEQKLTGLRQQQEGLRKKWEAAGKISDEGERRRELERLSRQQRELQEQTERLARRLERLQADRAGRSTAQGGGKMGQAGEQGQQGNGQAAAEQAQAAEKDLAEAQQQLAEALRQAEQELAEEQLARLEDGLKSLVQRQENVLEETRHYDELSESQGELTRAQLISVGDVAREQQALRDEVQALADKLTAKTFQFSLEGIAREMTAAQTLLERRQLGASAQQAIQQALHRLQQLLAALAPDQGEEQQEEDEGQQGGQGGGQQQGDGARLLSELKLLRLMQVDVNEQTKALEGARRQSGGLTAEQKRTYASLSEEQGKLADLLLDLMQPDEANPEDDPESLPDMPSNDDGEDPLLPPGGKDLK
jgi:hypothetical protein